VFDAVPLADAVAHFAHYHGSEITVSPAVKAAGLHVGGVYSIDDTEAFFTALNGTQPVRIERDARGAVRVSLRSEP
jgi:ferric-dicitrate binding protein FerR (iron transport regulator)